MLRRSLFTLLSTMMLVATGCGADEMKVFNRLDLPVDIEVSAPKADLRGGCNESFAERFCAEEFEVIGVLTISASEERLITISDPVTDEQCTNVLWLRLVRLGEVGPIDDHGTLIQMPADIEIEAGAGALHTVAFPQQTIRIDEAGSIDQNQALPPATCAELGRTPR